MTHSLEKKTFVVTRITTEVFRVPFYAGDGLKQSPRTTAGEALDFVQGTHVSVTDQFLDDSAGNETWSVRTEWTTQ